MCMSTRSVLVKKISKNSGLSLSEEDSSTMVDVFFSTIVDYLSRNNRVEIRGFGSFSVRGYVLHKPSSVNKRLSKSSYKKIYFRTSRNFLKEVN